LIPQGGKKIGFLARQRGKEHSVGNWGHRVLRLKGTRTWASRRGKNVEGTVTMQGEKLGVDGRGCYVAGSQNQEKGTGNGNGEGNRVRKEQSWPTRAP